MAGTNVPARTRVAIVDESDTIVEIVKFDHTYQLVRECKKMVDLGGHEAEVGWKHVRGVLVPPQKASDS